MSIEEAADALYERLRDAPWFTAVGIGEHSSSPCLYLYVTSLRKANLAFLKDGWHGFHVEVRKAGSPRLLHKPTAE